MHLSTVQRRLLTRTFILGSVLTLGVMVVEYFEGIKQFERYLNDKRALLCQFFSPPPSDKIWILALDDQTITEVGRWPWPRSKMATVFEELRIAGAKVIALDILLTEPEELRAVQGRDGTFTEVDNDQILADTFSRAGNVLVPASAGKFEEPVTDPLKRDLLECIRADLEIETPELTRQLVGRGHRSKEVEESIRQEFLSLQEQAMLERVDEIASGEGINQDVVVQRLAPRASARGERSDAVLLAERMYQRVQAMRRLDRFMQPVPEGIPPLLRAQINAMLIPVPRLVDAAAFSGYVDFAPEDDAVVRALPLVSVFRGKLYPHMVLSIACAELGASPNAITMTADSLTIPIPDSDPLVIPIRTIENPKHGTIGGFMDLSYFGRREWENMYDYAGGFRRTVQQELIKNVWRIEDFRGMLRRNRDRATEAMLFLNVRFLGKLDGEFAQELAKLDEAQFEAAVHATLSEPDTIKPTHAEASKMTAEELEALPEVKLLVTAYDALTGILKNNQYHRERIEECRGDLRKKLDGKIIMVGATALGLYDYYTTSLHPQCPGVVIQSVAVNGILTRNFTRRAPLWLSPFITAGFGALITLFVAFFSSYRALVATLLLAGAYLLVNGIFFYDYGRWMVPAAGAMTASGVVWGILTLYRYIFESSERARITKRFSGYVDPAIVNFVIEDPDKVRFDGEVREMTVVFTDLAGFTTISEKLQERTVPLLNDYMSRMMPIIRKYHGTWNKFLGDGIMFFFNAPAFNDSHARDAVSTVLEMQKAVEIFNVSLFEQKLPKVAMRAGITTGKMVVGDAGSNQAGHEAADYTVLGDEVNLAARLESANKAFGSRTLMTERTVELMGPGFLCRPMGRLQVVGKTMGVMTFEPLALEAEATDEQKEIARLSGLIVHSFGERRFEDAVAAAKEMQEKFGSSKFTAIYLEQAREYLIEPPPKDWDGTIVLESK